MPIKHQTQSYRTFGGARWSCLADVEVRDVAVAWQQALKAAGMKARSVSFKDEHFVRVFVEESSLQRACAVVNQLDLFGDAP